MGSFQRTNDAKKNILIDNDSWMRVETSILLSTCHLNRVKTSQKEIASFTQDISEVQVVMVGSYFCWKGMYPYLGAVVQRLLHR